MAMQETQMIGMEGETPKLFREFLGIKEEKKETPEQFEQRLLEAAQQKLRNPEVNRFYQIKVGRNEPCPCGSGRKFKWCCWGKINKGEFKVNV